MKTRQDFVAYAMIAVLGGMTIALGWDSWVNWAIFASVATGIMIDVYLVRAYWVGHVFSIISYGIYIPFCVFVNYYGEIIISILIIMISLASLVRWRARTEDKVVRVVKLGVRETVLTFGFFVGLFGVLGVVLWSWGAAYPVLGALGVSATCGSYYLCFRISRMQFICTTFDGAVTLSLWILAGMNEGWAYGMFAFGMVAQIYYAIVGFINWGRIERAQGVPVQG